MNKTQATALACSLVSQHLPNDWKFDWNNRKSALGVCNYRKKTIFLSTYFLNRIPDEEIEDTILHEIAHALAGICYGATGHGKEWKQICREIGAKPQRCHSGEVKNHTYRYTIKCPKCGHKSGRHRFNRATLKQLKSGYRWYNCRCNASRMNVYDNDKKIVDGNALKKNKNLATVLDSV